MRLGEVDTLLLILLEAHLLNKRRARRNWRLGATLHLEDPHCVDEEVEERNDEGEHRQLEKLELLDSFPQALLEVEEGLPIGRADDQWVIANLTQQMEAERNDNT